MIIILASMTAIDQSYYEAADIDGASTFQTFRHITLPLLKPVVFYILMTSIIGGMQNFDIPQVLFDGPGPDGSVRTMVMYMYNQAFKFNNLGYGASVSYALFGIIFVMAFPSMKKTLKNGGK